MLVHFIGGPAHGESRAIQNPSPTYTIATPRPSAIFRTFDVEDAPMPQLAECLVDEYHYKITKRTPRYAIAEWEALPVDVRFEVRLEIDTYAHETDDAIRQIYERRTETKHGVRCVAVHVANGYHAELTLVARVEGPEDATAIELAAKAVQHYLDSELPDCKQYIRALGASVTS